MKLERLGEFRVLTLRETATECPPAETPEMAVDYYRKHIESDPRFSGDVETLLCLVLSVRRKVQGHYIVATGTLDTILVHPREVFRAAIVGNASSIVIMHNHPSGDPTPSEEDVKVTRDLIRAGSLLQIAVLDHIVVGRESPERTKGYASLRELGYFYS